MTRSEAHAIFDLEHLCRLRCQAAYRQTRDAALVGRSPAELGAERKAASQEMWRVQAMLEDALRSPWVEDQ